MKLNQNAQKLNGYYVQKIRDIVITYVPQINNITIEDNYADISQEEIKNAYKENKRRAQKKRVHP